MKLCKTKTFRTHNSGQVLIVAALVISLIIISTVTYVYELATVENYSESMVSSEYILMIQAGSKHVLISSLSNITHNGAYSVLEENLQRWCLLISKQYTFGRSILNYALVETPPYSNGLWVSWTSNGYGVSSACANFSLWVSDQSITMEKSYFLNVSTILQIRGEFSPLNEGEKQVLVLVNLSDEDMPALAKSVSVAYRELDVWVETEYILTDYGNGTYRVLFSAFIPSDAVEVSLRVTDQRGIFVMANTTCVEI